MDSIMNETIKIVIDDAELWTRPFGDDKALVMATEGGVKRFLHEIYKKHPKYFELLEPDFCEEDLEGVFSLIVDPEVVQIMIMPGCGRFGFRIEVPYVNEDPDYEVMDHEEGDVI